VDQIAVRAVDLDDIEAGIQRAPRSGGECMNHDRNFVVSHLLWRRISRLERNGARRNRRPAALGFRNDRAALPGNARARLAPRVRELDSRRGAMLVQEARDSCQRRDMLVLPDAEIAGGDTAALLHRSCFGDHQSGTADGPRTQVDQMPIAAKAVFAGVLAHR